MLWYSLYVIKQNWRCETGSLLFQNVFWFFFAEHSSSCFSFSSMPVHKAAALATQDMSRLWSAFRVSRINPFFKASIASTIIDFWRLALCSLFSWVLRFNDFSFFPYLLSPYLMQFYNSHKQICSFYIVQVRWQNHAIFVL